MGKNGIRGAGRRPGPAKGVPVTPRKPPAGTEAPADPRRRTTPLRTEATRRRVDREAVERVRREAATYADRIVTALDSLPAPAYADLQRLGLDGAPSRTALDLLVAEQRILKVGKVGRADAYARLRGETPKARLRALARDALRQRAVSSQLVLFPLQGKAKAYNGIPSEVRKEIGDALKDLSQRREAFPIAFGRYKFVLLAANLALVLTPDSNSSVAPSPAEAGSSLDGAVPAPGPSHGIDAAVVRRVYARLTHETKSPNIVIAELQRQTQIPLERLKAWLLDECRAHRAVPLLGEPLHATPEELAAALHVQGRMHMYVRLLGDNAS